MFKYHSVIETSIVENLNYFKRLPMDLNKMEEYSFMKSWAFLRKICSIQYNIDNCLFDKYKNNKLCLHYMLTIY